MGEGRRARARAWRVVAAMLVLGAPSLALPSRGAEERCASWPGEPQPLPNAADADPIRARWAELRAAEVAALAQAAEATAPVESHRLWRRVLCLDPELDLAWQGLGRTRPVQVHRPPVGWGRPTPPAVADAWTALDAPVRIAREAPSAPPRSSREARARRELAEVERLLAQGDASLRAARFAQALEHAATARRRLEGSSSEARALRVRADVLAATAQVALGEEEAARQSFARALAADPGLRLDPLATSPKVMRVLEAARQGGAP
jgi:tetratricopeptide (TPR) repeat protein